MTGRSMLVLCPAEADVSWRQTTGSQTSQAKRAFGFGATLSRALMTSTRTRKGGAADTIWHTYCTAAAPLAAPREMSAANPDPAEHAFIHSFTPFLTHSLSPSLTQSPSHSLTLSLTHSFKQQQTPRCMALSTLHCTLVDLDLCWPHITSG